VREVAQYLIKFVSQEFCSYEKEEERRKKKEDDQIQLFDGLFLSSRIVNGMLVSIFVNCQAVSLSLRMLGLGFVASLTIIWVMHNYGKFKISIAIPK